MAIFKFVKCLSCNLITDLVHDEVTGDDPLIGPWYCPRCAAILPDWQPGKPDTQPEQPEQPEQPIINDTEDLMGVKEKYGILALEKSVAKLERKIDEIIESLALKPETKPEAKPELPPEAKPELPPKKSKKK